MKSFSNTCALVVAIVAMQCTYAQQAQETQISTSINSLSEPLSLEQAVALVDEQHPDMQIAKASVDDARAQLLQVEAQTGFNSFLDLAARKMKQSTSGDLSNDSYAKLVFSKTLYDFGRGNAQEASRTSLVSSSEHLFYNVRLQLQYEIKKRFFDVLLADSQYTVDNEEMTRRYLLYNKVRERHSLGIESDKELLKAENYYREALDKRVASDENRRAARLMLAMALNHPTELPDEILQPNLDSLDTSPPDVSSLFTQAMLKNQVILAMKQAVEAARNSVQAQRARSYPTISAEAEVADYVLTSNTRSDYAAGLTLRVPIYQGGAIKAETAKAVAALSSYTAKLNNAEQDMLVLITDLVKQLHILKTKRATAKQRVSYWDTELDYRRALYEMETQTNMSEVLARVSEAQWLALKTDFEIDLVWSRLHILLGNPPNSPISDIANTHVEETPQ